jgi:hypothetical protein
MNAFSQAKALRSYIGPEIFADRLGMTFRWALMELTGDSIPEPMGLTLPDTTAWFLESLDDQ